MTKSPLPSDGLIQINSVACDEHGALNPEMIALPFSMEARCLVALPFGCTACMIEGDEHALIYPPIVDWEPCESPLAQHISAIGHDQDATPPYYPIWEVRPTARTEYGTPIYRAGTRLSNPLAAIV